MNFLTPIHPICAVPFILVLVCVSSAQGTEKTVLPIPGGNVTFTVANVVATVEVRAKSLGPGACGVEFSTNFNDKIAFLAPPAIWSPWTVLASHSTKVTYRVSADVQCDTDALMEVKFFKK